MNQLQSLLAVFLLVSCVDPVGAADTFAPLENDPPPQNLKELWNGFDPRSEPLETEVLKQWEEDGVVMRVVRFRIGVFKGQTARLAAVYGYPKSAAASGTKLPGLLQIHGGGQYADSKACLTNAKRGYATVSIGWAGRINAPQYRVSPAEVKLFWDNKTDDPNYKLTTDWGTVDGYHAPSRNKGNQFPVIKQAAWTLDSVESPRNSGWFLCAVAARRALTFLERQPEIDADRLGVYGHSMGGKLTVMTSSDQRVKAAAPSCGGVSDRVNASQLFRDTLGDDASLKHITCPIFFLSPANDFHGRIGDLPKTIKEIKSDDWRVTCAPHHNHQDTSTYEVATQLWFDQHLKKSFAVPSTPQTRIDLNAKDGVPTFTVRPDQSKPIASVDVFYTHHGKADEGPQDRDDTIHRFWHHAATSKTNDAWTAKLPLASTDKPLWVYANVHYKLDQPITGTGYYYRVYTTDTFNLSSLLTMVPATKIAESSAVVSMKPMELIEDFQGDWKKQWFGYRSNEWTKMTNKFSDAIWAAPKDATLSLQVKSEQANELVLVMGDYVSMVQVQGGPQWQTASLKLSDFRNLASEPLPSWTGVRQLKLTHLERLRAPRGSDLEAKNVGKNWAGSPPQFRDLRWKQNAQ